MPLSQAQKDALIATSNQLTAQVNALVPDPVASDPTVTLSAGPSSITAGASSTLSWSSTNATAVSIDHGIGAVGLSGTKVVTPALTTMYTATAVGIASTTPAMAQATVIVSAATTPPAALKGGITTIVAGVSATGWASPPGCQITLSENDGIYDTVNVDASGNWTRAIVIHTGHITIKGLPSWQTFETKYF